MENCNHVFHHVYYGSEWEVECKKCSENIRGVYSREVGVKFINNMLNTRILQKNNLFYPQYKEKYKNIFLKNKERWRTFRVWDEGGFDLIGIPSSIGYKTCEGFFTKEYCEEFIQKELEKQIIQIYEPIIKR